MTRALALGLALAAGACAPAVETAAPPEGWREELHAWRADREEGLRSPTGWLSLVALGWLGEGETTVGSSPDNGLRLPEGSCAPRVGRFLREGDVVRFVAAEGVPVRVNGRDVREAVLRSDATGDPDRLSAGRIDMTIIERRGRLGVRAKDPQAPALDGFEGVPAWPPDPAYRVLAHYEPFAASREVAIPTAIGPGTMKASGQLVFRFAGEEHALLASAQGDGAGGFFVVFGDATNGQESYAAGRFLAAGPPDEKGRVVLDFNRAVNPPCAFTDYATCPYPPAENRLDVAIRAGEKRTRKR